ncbi:hypothetical protein NC652_032748 [Populus alba x Populus x berolinensis]|nr:hypothetical protein NC652_032748 [Populus alba x Populus x berolinensis]
MSGVQSVRMSVVQFGLGVHIMGGVLNKEELKMSSCCFPVKLERSFKNYSSKKLDKSPTKDNYCFQSLLVPNSIGIPVCVDFYSYTFDSQPKHSTLATEYASLLEYQTLWPLQYWINNILRNLRTFNPNLKLLLATEGSDGCRYDTKEFKGKVSGVKVGAVDTTGLDEKKLKEPLLFTNVCGAISVYRRGAIPAVPPKDAVLKVLRPGALLE